MSASAWTVFPHFVVRTTGFACDLVEGIRHHSSVAAATEAVAIRREVARLRAEAPRVRRPSRALVAAVREERPLPTAFEQDPDWAVRWNAATQRLAAADQALEETFAADAAEATAALRAIARERRFGEALACSSPAVLRDIERERWSRRLERQVAAYLQRFCAKNETMAFAGPINYGELSPAEAGGIELSWSGPTRLAARRTYLSSVLLRALADRIAFDREIVPWLVLRPKAFRRPLEHVDADSLLGRLVASVDGRRSLGAVAAEVDAELDEVAPLVRAACRRGLLTHQLEVPASSVDGLPELLERVAGLPTRARRRHLDVLGEILRLRRRFSAAPPDRRLEAARRVSELAGVDPDGAAPGNRPKFYADRLALREECAGDLRLRIRGRRARELAEEVGALLEILARDAVTRRRSARSRVAEHLGAGEFPLWRVVSAAGELPLRFESPVREAVTACVPDATVEEVALDAADIAPEDLPEDEAFTCTVDVMVCAPDLDAWNAGRYELVAADIHDTALLGPWALQFHELGREIATELSLALGRIAPDLPLVSILAGRRTGLPILELPGAVTELGGTSRSDACRIGLDDLVVRSDGRDADLFCPPLQTPVLLANGELDTIVHTAFALPRIRPLRISLGEQTPRLKVGRVIAQRRRWDLGAERLEPMVRAGSDRERLRHALELWGELGLPDAVFAQAEGQQKPVLVDVRAPLLLRVLAHVAAGAAVVFTEMRPRPDELWLRSGEGRHTSELRCVFLRTGTEA